MFIPACPSIPECVHASSRSARVAARACVDKFFTYATPHNGIELAGQNVPEWLSKDDIDNFNRDRMAQYMDLKARLRKG